MNRFLELYSSSDYRLTNRDYYTSTWEYITIASDYLIPFQFTTTASDFRIYSIDKDDSETDITKYFDTAQLITDWTESAGTLVNTGPLITSWTGDAGEYVYSDDFTLTDGDEFYFQIDPTKWDSSASYNVQLMKGAAPGGAQQWAETMDGLTGKRFAVSTTGIDYYFKITNQSGGAIAVTANTPWGAVSNIINEASGNRYWYDGSQLSSTLSGVLRIRIDTSFYSDWMDTCGFTDKTKIKVSSSYDYGTIKYDEGFEQWMYKDATVRRFPKAEIEIIGDTLNGERINEKITSAVRYTAKMKCTEAEFEALVHGIGGTIEITDKDGKAYDAQNVELSDPTMYRTNGVVELSFVDGNNINVWHRNLTSL